MRLLLVEDDHELADWLMQGLVQRGFHIDWADDGRMAEQRALAEDFDVILLDLGLPFLSGSQLLARLKARGNETPVLVMTARDTLAQRVALLRDGADDFMGKPLAIEELEVRLHALIRRSHGRARGIYTCGPLSFDQASQSFTLTGRHLSFSPREHAVLRLLIQKQGDPLSKQQIIDRLVTMEEDLNPEAIEVIVHRLRKKLGEGSVQIVTLRGVGYLLEAEADA
ncbi:response regulator [Falsirhodobacter sp. 20TX0035]|uniref:response regulator n=1 Tax=Falsirhodobacter sp. 20TX0035 TaxID=3022019 RepID=UPI00232B6DB6|nr:response regulator [Falsirhodobacter sp. 20TX0035]MDB6454177.1 response regulator [Falsirhodobacter sp. 20TX0035]